MNLINRVGNISIKVEQIGLDIQIGDISVETQDVNPVEYIQVIQAKKEQMKEINEIVKNSIEVLKEVKASSPGPSQNELNKVLDELTKKIQAKKASNPFGGDNPFGPIKF
jgi:hypothetical protein